MSYTRKRTRTVDDQSTESERSSPNLESQSRIQRPALGVREEMISSSRTPSGMSRLLAKTRKVGVLASNSIPHHRPTSNNVNVEDRSLLSKVPQKSIKPSQTERAFVRSSENRMPSSLQKLPLVGSSIPHTAAMHDNSSVPSQLGQSSSRPSQNRMPSLSRHPSQSLSGNIPIGTEFDEYENEQDDEQEDEQGNVNKSKPSRRRGVQSRPVTPNWPESLKFDEKDEVLTIDSEGNRKILSGPIQPRDVDNICVAGVRCMVNFNAFNQPIRKGGFVLVKYLGWLAKIERFCPIGAETWHKVNEHYKVELVKVIRAKFVIPDGRIFDKAILMRICKQWRHYKHTLKMMKFNPDKRSKEEIINDAPGGHTRDSWMRLVENWYSEKNKNYSRNGKAARASQSHMHTTGCICYANKRADFVESKGSQPSNLEFFELTHTKVGGGFVEHTVSAQLLEEANSTVEELVRVSSPSKSRSEIENGVFDKLMHEEENPKRPILFGFGVNKGQVSGVHGILRKRGYGSTTSANHSTEMENMKGKLKNMETENKELRAKVDQSNQILLQTLNAIRTGEVSDEFFNAARVVLRMSNSQSLSSALPFPAKYGCRPNANAQWLQQLVIIIVVKVDWMEIFPTRQARSQAINYDKQLL